MNSKKIRKTTFFEGHVQGVGFRYKALHLSKGYDITGFVKNLDDGRVQLVAVGVESEVKSFVDELKAVMSDYIRKTIENSEETELNYNGFKIEL